MKPQDRKAGSCVKEMKQRLGLWVLVDNPERPIRDALALGLALGGVRKVRERICEENDSCRSRLRYLPPRRTHRERDQGV